ncbi:hypothetical protein Pint_15328 [Pistacia integerrima]|uniref:Uncharacterized protein n=1 Tax=Pistacia integerrima TaxID=434235 RepID=A0ACC0ZFI8_9ROSI|nr:hypothetical protein Pint_15328 [Pistacia integerrima]
MLSASSRVIPQSVANGSTQISSQQPSIHCLGNEFLEVESELQSNHSVVSDTGNYFATNTSTLEVEPGLPSNHNLFHDPFAPITSSIVRMRMAYGCF